MVYRVYVEKKEGFTNETTSLKKDLVELLRNKRTYKFKNT